MSRTLLMVGCLLLPTLAQAHFVLQAPAASTSQGPLGDPQKSPPCGGGAENSTVTPFTAGDTVTITVKETVTHAGHYRVALAADPAHLPAEPMTHAGRGWDCDTADIDANPSMPVLADGKLVHTAAFSGPQSFTVTIPTNFSCAKCTLQVIEFMSNHDFNTPGGCYYHHCANISVAALAGAGGGSAGAGGGMEATGGGSAAVGGGTAAVGGGNADVGGGAAAVGGGTAVIADAGTGNTTPTGGCSATSAGGAMAMIVAGALELWRRRRRS